MSFRRTRSAAFLALAMLLATPALAAATADPSGDLQARAAKALATSTPKAAVILDPSDGKVLYGFHADDVLPPASLIKMLTALVVADTLEPDDIVTIDHRAAYARADQLAWREGAQFTADQVMHGMLMQSSNGAALALANAAGGSIKGFRELAHTRAAELGLTHTVLLDPSGLDAKGQHSSAYDLAVITSALLHVPWLAHVVATKDFPVAWPDGTTAHFGNIDRFVNEYPGAVGVKNGYTSLAGNCVAAAAVRDGKTLIVVVLNDPHVYDTAARLMDIGFTSGVPIGTWRPDELPRQVEPSVDAVRNLAVAKTHDIAAPVVAHHFPVRWVVLGFVALWAARFIQIRRRRIRRRRAQREVRMAARRARVDQLYVGPRPDVSEEAVWLTTRPFEVDDEPRKPQRRRAAR